MCTGSCSNFFYDRLKWGEIIMVRRKIVRNDQVTELAPKANHTLTAPIPYLMNRWWEKLQGVDILSWTTYLKDFAEGLPAGSFYYSYRQPALQKGKSWTITDRSFQLQYRKARHFSTGSYNGISQYRSCHWGGDLYRLRLLKLSTIRYYHAPLILAHS